MALGLQKLELLQRTRSKPPSPWACRRSREFGWRGKTALTRFTSIGMAMWRLSSRIVLPHSQPR
jgi:hypothetical protein